MVINNQKNINSKNYCKVMLPNSKIFNIKETDFKYKIHYDQLNDTVILSIEEQVNYIFNAYKKRYTLPTDADVTFESDIYNDLQDFFDRCPEAQQYSSPGMSVLGLSRRFNQYLFYQLPNEFTTEIGSVLAHEIAHSLNYYNRQKYGIHITTRGNRTEHDEVYDFGRDVGKEMFFLLKERESGYDGRLSTAVQSRNISKVRDLLNSGTNINAKDNVGQTPLHKATDENIARLLIERGADINVKDNSGKTAFEIALEHDNIEVANFLANAKDKCGKTMLHYAAEDNNLHLVGLLIDKGADINAKDNVGQTPLHKATDESIARLLIERGADINVKDNSGKTAFEIALEHDNIEVANFLVNAKDKYGKTMLHYAAEDDNLRLIRLLIDNGADINAKDNGNKTPFEIVLEGLIPLEGPIPFGLEFLSKEIKISMVRFLTNVKDKYGKTMLHYAAKDNNLNLVTLLIDNGADINAKDKGDKTPFEIALEDKKTQVANFLANAKDKYDKTMLHYAAKDSNLNLVKLLIDNGADVNARDNDDKTPLHYAVGESIARLLIERGADFNAKEIFDNTPFEIALRHQKIEVANFLTNAKDKYGKTMLHYAAEDDNLYLVTLLIDRGADFNAKDDVGKTPLHYAVSKSIARFLIERGADVNVKDNGNKTPFEIALEHPNMGVANFLTNAKDKYGKTMLHYAAKDNDLNLVTLLINNGADINAKDNVGQTPLHKADDESIARLLVERGANINVKDNRDKTPFEVVFEGLTIESGDNIIAFESPTLRIHKIIFKYYNREVARFLANAKDKYGKTMLHYAAEDNNLNLVELLIENGANIEAKGDIGVTPLYCAARDGYLEIARFLLDKGADANARAGIKVTAHAWTPLHTAAAHGEIETQHPGYWGSQDTYYVGNIKGIGRIYQQTFVDTYSRVAMVKLYTDRTAITAADLLNDRVIPFFDEQKIPLLRILTDRGTEYCGKPENHAYQLYLGIENILELKPTLHRLMAYVKGFIELCKMSVTISSLERKSIVL